MRYSTVLHDEKLPQYPGVSITAFRRKEEERHNSFSRTEEQLPHSTASMVSISHKCQEETRDVLYTLDKRIKRENLRGGPKEDARNPGNLLVGSS